MSKENGDKPAASDDSTLSELKEGEGAAPEQPADTDADARVEKTEATVPGGLESRLRELEVETRELNDQLLRKQADFENFRKRMFREKEEAIKFANSELLSDLITIIDDFERAIRSSEKSKDFNSFHAGVEMIEKQFTSMLERKYGLKRFESTGEEFDPGKHQAISVGNRHPDAHAQIVLEDYQKGYMLHDRVLRPAKVKVSREPAGDDQKDEEIEGEE
jgi:molecular chaperone GrpE